MNCRSLWYEFTFRRKHPEGSVGNAADNLEPYAASFVIREWATSRTCDPMIFISCQS